MAAAFSDRPEVRPDVKPPPDVKLVLVGWAPVPPGVVDVAVGYSFVELSVVSKHVRSITFRRDLPNKKIGGVSKKMM